MVPTATLLLWSIPRLFIHMVKDGEVALSFQPAGDELLIFRGLRGRPSGRSPDRGRDVYQNQQGGRTPVARASSLCPTTHWGARGRSPQSREGTPMEERERPQDLEAMSYDELLRGVCAPLPAPERGATLMVREILRSGSLMPGMPPPDWIRKSPKAVSGHCRYVTTLHGHTEVVYSSRSKPLYILEQDDYGFYSTAS